MFRIPDLSIEKVIEKRVRAVLRVEEREDFGEYLALFEAECSAHAVRSIVMRLR